MFDLGHETAYNCLVKVSIASDREFIIVWLTSGIHIIRVCYSALTRYNSLLFRVFLHQR